MAGHAKKKTVVSVKIYSRKATVKSIGLLGEFCSVATLFIAESLKANWSETYLFPLFPTVVTKTTAVTS